MEIKWLEKLPTRNYKNLPYNLPVEFCAFPAVVLDKISTFLALVGTICWPLQKRVKNERFS